MVKTICVDVWGENWCDDDFTISEINGFGLEEVLLIKDALEEQFEELLSMHRECLVRLIPRFEPAQIGNYPPPNIEIEEYWDFEISIVTTFEELWKEQV